MNCATQVDEPLKTVIKYTWRLMAGREVVYMIRAFNPARFEIFIHNGVVYRDLKLVKRIVKKSIEQGFPATWETLEVW